ncbi:MAG: sulfatase [Bryobacterales bacterium]|nr:sulfatase [Bryobacterales bacterium]
MLMNRRHAVSTIFAGAGSAFAQKTNRPNLVFVLIDDLRWNGLSCMGHPFVKTPNIDRIGREGAIFRNAFVTTPLCSPSRGSFLTGQYVRTHGVRGNGDSAAASHKMITFPRLLRDAGYETAYVGKWHMGNDDSPRPGFDRWVSFRGQGVFEDPPLNIDGERITRNGYMTDLLSDHAVDFVKKGRSKPFCLYLAHKAIHGPFTPAPRHANMYADQPIQRTPNAKDTLEGKPMLRREIPELPQKKKKGAGQAQSGPGDELIRNQMRCMLSIDEGVGRILDVLEQQKALDNTMIVFTSDNGYFWGEHGLGDKRAAYEESIRIPMLARYPKLIKAGRQIDGMALNIDIAPTMLDAAGLKPHAQMQGRSLMPLLEGKSRNWRKSILCEYFMEQQFARVASWEAVRTERYKYIRYLDLKEMDELYDLQADPGEMKNLINDAGSRATLENLKKELAGYPRIAG